MICFLIAAIACLAVYHFTFLKPKWMRFAADEKFPGKDRQLGYWSIRGQFELQMWLGGVNYPAKGAHFVEYLRTAALFIVTSIATMTTCKALIGDAS